MEDTVTAKRMTIVRNGRVLDIVGHRATPSDILIAGDTIAEVGQPGLAAPADAVLIDATDRLIHAGLINAHTHGHGNLSKGIGDRSTLELLLTAAPSISGNRTTEDKYLSTYIGALEMLLKGCTACYDLTVEFPQPTPEGLTACARAYADADIYLLIEHGANRSDAITEQHIAAGVVRHRRTMVGKALNVVVVEPYTVRSDEVGPEEPQLFQMRCGRFVVGLEAHDHLHLGFLQVAV